MLGRFLEFSVPAPDIIDSLGFYKLLGFRELDTSDVLPHKYAVISDGDICIGLHGEPVERCSLTFVLPEIAREARSMLNSGLEFEFLRIDEDVFNEAGFACRDGHRVTLIEARTFAAVGEGWESSVCGRFFELTLPVRDTLRAGRFWAPLAPELLRVREEPTTHMRFNAAGLPLGLSESIALTGPSLCFLCDDLEAVWVTLARHRFTHKEHPGFEGALMQIDAPEGTPLFLFSEDFLGELYEVEELPADA